MFFGIRDRDPGRARNGMVIGIMITIMFLILIMSAMYTAQQNVRETVEDSPEMTNTYDPLPEPVIEPEPSTAEQETPTPQAHTVLGKYVITTSPSTAEQETSTAEQETPTPQNPALNRIMDYDPSLAAMFSDARFNDPNREPSHDEFFITHEDGVYAQYTTEYMELLIDNGYFHRAWGAQKFSEHCREHKLQIHEEKQSIQGMLPIFQFLTTQERLDYREESNMRIIAMEIRKAQICT